MVLCLVSRSHDSLCRRGAILCELRMRVPAEDDDVANHDAGGWGFLVRSSRGSERAEAWRRKLGAVRGMKHEAGKKRNQA